MTATALDFEVPAVKLNTRFDTNREATRYVACLGNHLEHGDRRQLSNIGGWAGGVWIGHSEVEGAPTLKRTHYMILRGLFTPLETTAIPKKADHRELDGYRENYLDGPGVSPGTRGYTVYAGQDLSYLQGDRFRPMGIVEITPLIGVNWNDELRASFQRFFFPEWELWQKGEGEIPELLSDWETLVKTALNKAQYASHATIGEELLESARLFRIYASNQIEKNRQIIQSMRSSDTGGQYVGWHNKSRIYAQQLGITLEDENSIAPISGDSTALIAELRADRQLRQKELEMQEQLNKALVAKLTGEEIKEEPINRVKTEEELVAESVSFGQSIEPVVEEPVIQSNDPLDLAPKTEEFPAVIGCPNLNGKGEPCKGKVYPGELFCVFHGGKKS